MRSLTSKPDNNISTGAVGDKKNVFKNHDTRRLYQLILWSKETTAKRRIEETWRCITRDRIHRPYARCLVSSVLIDRTRQARWFVQHLFYFVLIFFFFLCSCLFHICTTDECHLTRLPSKMNVDAIPSTHKTKCRPYWQCVDRPIRLALYRAYQAKYLLFFIDFKMTKDRKTDAA